MKNLYDIYENGTITATPGNTVGMGNPMLPTAEEPGTEPLQPTVKLKKKSKKVKEGLLSDIDSTLQTGGILLEFATWFVDNLLTEYPAYKKDREHCIEVILHGLTLKSKDAIVIDVKAIEDKIVSSKYDTGMIDGYTMLVKTPIPKSIKKLEVHNAADTFCILSYLSDLSGLDISVYNDAGQYYGNCSAAFKPAITNCKFGLIECAEFAVSSLKLTDITLDKESIILEIDTTRCSKLEEIYNKESALSHISHGKFNLVFIKYQLEKARVIPWSATLSIKSAANKTLKI